MSQISRLKSVEIANGNLINADDLNAEFDQLVDESNGQDTRLSSIENGTAPLSGIKTNAISESTSGNGVRVDGVRLHDGTVNSRPILSPIASIDVNTDQITSPVAHGLSTGDPVGIAVGSASGTMPGGLSETMTYYARVVSATVIALHPTEPDAEGGTNTVGIMSAGTGTLNLIVDPASPTPGDIWVSPQGALTYQSGGNTYTAMDGQGRYLARYETHSAAPVYKTSTTFAVDHIASRDWGNAYNIINDAPVTVDISTAGINGLVQFSAAGTITVTNGTNTVAVSGGAGGFAIGDVLATNGGQIRQVSAVDGSGNPSQVSSNWTSTETNVSFKYGGRCPNTWYYAYETISFGFVGILLSTRNQAGGQPLDFSTTAFRQMPFALRLDASGNIVPFYLANWGERPMVLFQVPGNAVASSSVRTWTAVSLANQLPKISRLAYVHIEAQHNTASSSGTFDYAEVRPTGSSQTVGMVRAVLRGTSSGNFDGDANSGYCATNGSQSIDYQCLAAAGGTPNMSVDVLGFVVTEVP